MKNWLILFILILIIPSSLSAESLKKHVLFLNSYQNGYAWSDKIVSGAQSVFRQSDIPIELYVEYMDTKRFNNRESAAELSKHYAFKYKNYNFSAIIVSDNNALSFMASYHEKLFPGVPVIFCGINNFNPAEIENKFHYAGITETPAISAIINLAEQFVPDLQKIVVIGDSSTTSSAILAQIKTVAKEHDGVFFEYWINESFTTLTSKISSLKKNEVVFFTPFYKGATGDVYSAEELSELLSQESSVMIFTAWKFLMNHGVIGGKLLSGIEQGEEVANIALRFFATGVFPDQEVVTLGLSQYIFDYNILKKFNIKLTSLPPDSIIINEPESFYKLKKGSAWIILIAVIILCFMVLQATLFALQRRKSEKRIEAQLLFQESLMDTLPLLVCWRDINKKYLGSNSAFSQFFKLPAPHELIGISDKELNINSEFAQYAEQLENEVLKTGKPALRAKHSYVNEANKDVWLEINKVPLYNEEKSIVGTLTTLQDITLRTNLEKQLLQSQKFEAIGSLAGGISHDFNNILSSIANSIELASIDIDPQSMTWADLERARKAAYRGSNLVKQILTFSSHSQDGFETTNFVELINETVDFITSSFPKNINVQCHIDGDIPLIHVDATQIHQVIMNLCTNAYQSIKKKGGEIQIRLSIQLIQKEHAQILGIMAGEYLLLEIIDDGPGISPLIIDRIFDPFVTTKSTAEGTGLGLAIVHGIVQSHNGTINVTSTPNIRTAFSIYLPMNKVKDGLAISETDFAPRGNEHILFVEDDQDQLDTTPRLLETLGYKVVAIPSPEEAYNMIMKKPKAFQLIISDYDMPQITGLELAKRLNKIVPYIPVMIVSGKRNVTEHINQMENIHNVIMKPYTKQTLAVAIREALMKEK